MPAGRSLALVLRPPLRFGLILGLAISAVLAIPWFGGDAVDPAGTPRIAVAPPARPAPDPPGESAPPLPPAESPVEIAALLPAGPPVYRPDSALAGGSLASVRTTPVIRAGVASSLPEIRALAPEHVGASAQASPTLYWFLSGESSAPVEIALRSERAEAPLLALRLSPPVRAGLHSLRLERHGVRLEPNVTHEWSVALVPDPSDPGARLVSSAAVRRAGDAAELPAAAPEEQAQAQAAAGYWYDAFETLTTWIQAEPAAQNLREHRAALLEQVGLAGVAGLLSAPTPPRDAAATSP